MMTRNSSGSEQAERVLAAVSVCTILVVGFVASINLAAPKIASGSLHPSSAQLLWIVDAYVVFFACLVIPAGAVGDRFGRKRVVLAGLVTFAAGAAVSAAAPTVAVMLIGRAVTGVGAAMVLPNGLALLIHATAPAQRPKAIAVWAAMTGVGGVVGNIGGGAVLAAGSWRWLFVAVVPIALAAAGWLAVVAPVTDTRDEPLNLKTAALLTAATVALLLGIIEGPQHGWDSAAVVGAFIAAVLLLAMWAVSELRAAHPMLDPRLFAIPALRSASLGMMVLFFGLFGLFYLNASLMQYGRGFSTLQTGFAVIPLSLPLLIGARFVPGLAARLGAPVTLGAAFVVTSVGLFGLGTAINDRYLIYAAWLVLIGIGIALGLPALTGTITASIPPEQAGVAGGLQSTTRELGSALGVAVIGTLTAAQFGNNLHTHTSRTVAQVLAAAHGNSGIVLQAYTDAGATTLKIVAVVVLIAGILVATESVWSAKPRG